MFRHAAGAKVPFLQRRAGQAPCGPNRPRGPAPSGQCGSWLAPGPAQRASPRRQANQNPLTSRRPPVTVMPDMDVVGTAAARMAALIWAAVLPGWSEAYKATAPVT